MNCQGERRLGAWWEPLWEQARMPWTTTWQRTWTEQRDPDTFQRLGLEDFWCCGSEEWGSDNSYYLSKERAGLKPVIFASFLCLEEKGQTCGTDQRVYGVNGRRSWKRKQKSLSLRESCWSFSGLCGRLKCVSCSYLELETRQGTH